MRKIFGLTVLVFCVFAIVGMGGAQALAPQHGISFTKGCASPRAIGSPYSCTYSARNNIDDAADTLTISGLVDTVHSAGGDVSSGNVFGSQKFVIGAFSPGFSTPPSCPGATGTGTAADPWRAPGLTSCFLPFGSRLDTQPFSFYTPTSADFGLPGHVLTDSASLHWNDLCDGLAAGPPPGGGNCNPTPPDVGAASQSLITQLGSSTATAIHDAAHGVVTTVPAGSTVHDFVTVTGQAGQAAPSGNVSIDWFTNSTCTGAPASSSGSVGPLVAGGGSSSSFDATGFAQGPLAPGSYGFMAHYAGDATYAGSDGACEPLTVQPGSTGKHLTYSGSMEGDLSFLPGAWVSGGYHFQLSQKNSVPVTVTVTGNINVPVHCTHDRNSPVAGVISVPVSIPPFTIPAGSTSWYLTGDQNSILTWMGAVQAPNFCAGGLMNNQEGATFDVVVNSSAHVGVINFQWHYRIPAAKNKPNTDCTNATDPNRNRADVCGASWSSTKDP